MPNDDAPGLMLCCTGLTVWDEPHDDAVLTGHRVTRWAAKLVGAASAVTVRVEGYGTPPLMVGDEYVLVGTTPHLTR